MRKPDASGPGSTESSEGESLYRRWSRRKSQSRSGEPDRDDGRREAASSEPVAVSPEAAAEPPVLTDADMPALDSLQEDSDYSGFMSEGVSEELRNKALRKLFLSSKFNIVDGLDDYDDDFTAFEALGDIITSDMRHQLEREAERAKQELEQQAQALSEDPVKSAAAETGEQRELARQTARSQADAGSPSEQHNEVRASVDDSAKGDERDA